jgi:hypothetical protein
MWLYKDKPFSLPEDFNPKKPEWQGFVYLITNLKTGRKYIGKKFFVSIKGVQRKGKRIRTKVESDWQTYYGSSDNVKVDVAELGAENFKREIIYLCKTKSECGYIEAYEQFVRHAIISDDYYNDWVSCRVRISHLRKYQHELMEKLTTNDIL